MGMILIQIVFYQTLFLALYEVFLKQDTHYNLQRFYLLLLPIFALFLPFIVVPVLSEGISETYQVSMPVIFLSEVGGNSELMNADANVSVGNEYSTLLSIWVVGVVFSSIWFLWKYLSLLKLRANASIVDKGNYKLASLPKTDVAFSFGRTIYLGEELEEKAKEVILKHEKVHIAQRHSIDLIVYQLLRIVFWWNPMLYFFQNRLQAVHEYIADAEVVQSIAKKEYYQNLLSQVFKTNGISFTNTFYKQSLIKNRIIMLQKIKSSRKSKFKYLLIFPLLAFMLVVVSCADDEQVPDSVVVTKDMPQPPMPPPPPRPATPFSEVETVPTFPSCEDESDLSACMNRMIQEHVADNFNKDLGKELGLEGLQRIMVMFAIDENGDVGIIQVRGTHEELMKEARRVVELLPQFIPGEHNGEKVRVSYTLPINFEVE